MPANRRSNEYCQYLNWIKIERLATYTSRTWFPSSKNPWWQVPLKRGAAIGLVTITPPTGVTGRAQECSGRNGWNGALGRAHFNAVLSYYPAVSSSHDRYGLAAVILTK